MTDITKTIAPKSDQLNADDLIGRTDMTITVTKVSMTGSKEQPVSIHYEGENGKPYKPNLSMRRVLVQLWGGTGEDYIGRSMTLYRDEKVTFSAMEVGGLKISHLSNISEPITIVLTKSRGKKAPHIVRPLAISKQAKQEHVATQSEPDTRVHDGIIVDTVDFITPDQQTYIGDLLANHDDLRMKIVRKYGAIAKIPSIGYQAAVEWITGQT